VKNILHVTITTDTVDRDGDIVEPKGIKLTNYRRNNVVLLAHDYRGLPIAKGENLKRNEHGIDADVEFPEEGTYPLSDTVYQMGKGGFIKAWSIGFIPIKTEDIVDEDEKGKDSESMRRRGKRIKSCELLEFSACAVGCNPEALTNMMAKGINIDTLKEAGFIEIEEDVTEQELQEEKEQSDELLELDENPYLDEEYKKALEEKETITKPEETEEFIHIPVRSAADFVKDSFKTIDIDDKKGIKAVIGKLKSDPDGSTKVQKYIFDKSKGWTLEKAKKWVDDHKKEYDEADLDESFLKDEKEEKGEGSSADEVIKEEEEDKLKEIGLFDIQELAEIVNRNKELVNENKELKEKVDKLENENKELELKAGAVLNKRNKQDLKDAQAKIQNVLDSAEPIEEEDSLEIEDTKDVKEDNTVIDLEANTVDDPVIDEEKDKDAIEVDGEMIKRIIDSKFDYVLGRIK